MDPPCVARENDKPWRVRSCINVSGLVLELMLRTIMEIRAHPILLPAMPRRAMWVINSRMRWEDHFSISSFLSQTSVGKRSWRLHRVSPDCEHFVLIHAAWDAGFIGLTSKLRPPCRTPHTMRAILLASAIASLKRLSRRAAASIQDLRPCFSQLLRAQ
jgi:hypothetical protein